MSYIYEDVKKSVDTIKRLTNNFTPEVAIILGSGLSPLAELVENKMVIEYKDIENFKVSTAPGHTGRLVCGNLGGKRVVVMQGRVHYYEGYSYNEVAFPVHVMAMMGAKKLIVSNAAGGVNQSFKVGELMLILDHIKFFDESPLRGKNIKELGERFFDMSFTYSERLIDIAKKAAAEENILLNEGVYFYMPGPQYETPAEIRAIRTLGGDAVGMSTVPEVIAAAHCKMEVLGVSLICNMAAGILKQPLTEKEVLDEAEKAKKSFTAFVKKCLELM